jgi:hypothetical protein
LPLNVTRVRSHRLQSFKRDLGECLKCRALATRHCEERSDEAIHLSSRAVRWIASLRSQ